MDADLESRIVEHDRTLAGLKMSVGDILVNVEQLTEQARAALADYQLRKRQANAALGLASQEYHAAAKFFGRVDDLNAQLATAKQEHVELSQGIIQLAAQDPDTAQRLIPRLKASRKRLRKLYGQIERCRRDARMGDEHEIPLAQDES